MNFPLAARSAYLALRRCNRYRLGMNLKAMRRAVQYSYTVVSSDSALSSVADIWIFQPCEGSSASTGRSASQSPLRCERHPAGTGASAAG